MSNEKDIVPQHVAIVMDGNGRWAGQRGQNRLFGHYKGVETVRLVVSSSVEFGVKYLTLYAFSTENWGRPKDEVLGIMDIILNSLLGELDNLHSKGVRLMFIGDRSVLNDKLVHTMDQCEQKTAANNTLTLIIAINYSSKREIASAVKQISEKVQSGQIDVNDVDQELIDKYLYTSSIPNPDLMIRTSGERRMSNFLLWQMAYTELYFTDVLWPEFDKQEYAKALKDFAGRHRRYGLL